jgi:hypothetical protein
VAPTPKRLPPHAPKLIRGFLALSADHQTIERKLDGDPEFAIIKQARAAPFTARIVVKNKVPLPAFLEASLKTIGNAEFRVAVEMDYRNWAKRIAKIVEQIRLLNNKSKGRNPIAVLATLDDEQCKQLIEFLLSVRIDLNPVTRIPQSVDRQSKRYPRPSECEMEFLTRNVIRFLGETLEPEHWNDDVIKRELEGLHIERHEKPETMDFRVVCDLEVPPTPIQVQQAKTAPYRPIYEPYTWDLTINVSDALDWDFQPILVSDLHPSLFKVIASNGDGTFRRINIATFQVSALYNRNTGKYAFPILEELLALSKQFESYDRAVMAAKVAEQPAPSPPPLTAAEMKFLHQWWVPPGLKISNTEPMMVTVLKAFEKRYKRVKGEDIPNYRLIPLKAFPDCNPKSDEARLPAFLKFSSPLALDTTATAAQPNTSAAI